MNYILVHPPEEEDAGKSGGRKVDIINDWGYIEADFQREYGINLMEELDKMSWRRFLTLLRGLSGDAVFVIMNTDPAEREGVKVIDGEDAEAQSIVRSFFGG